MSDLGPDPSLFCTMSQTGQAGFLVGLEVPVLLKLASASSLHLCAPRLRCLVFDFKSPTPSPRISTSLFFPAENLTQGLENGQHSTTELELLLGDMVSYVALKLTT